MHTYHGYERAPHFFGLRLIMVWNKGYRMKTNFTILRPNLYPQPCVHLLSKSPIISF